jgi:hypothetical protein
MLEWKGFGEREQGAGLGYLNVAALKYNIPNAVLYTHEKWVVWKKVMTI